MALIYEMKLQLLNHVNKYNLLILRWQQRLIRLINLERVNAVSQTEKSAFLLSIANGDYDDDPARMIQDIETGQYPYDMITTALSVWTSTHGRILKAEEPIFIANTTYM